CGWARTAAAPGPTASAGCGATPTCGSTTGRSSPTPRASTRRRRSWPSPPATATSSWPTSDHGRAGDPRPPPRQGRLPVTEPTPPTVPAGAPAATVVVTGASGWLGQNLVRTLVGQRDRVRCLVPTEDQVGPLALLSRSVEVVAGD